MSHPDPLAQYGNADLVIETTNKLVVNTSPNIPRIANRMLGAARSERFAGLAFFRALGLRDNHFLLLDVRRQISDVG